MKGPWKQTEEQQDEEEAEIQFEGNNNNNNDSNEDENVNEDEYDDEDVNKNNQNEKYQNINDSNNNIMVNNLTGVRHDVVEINNRVKSNSDNEKSNDTISNEHQQDQQYQQQQQYNENEVMYQTEINQEESNDVNMNFNNGNVNNSNERYAIGSGLQDLGSLQQHPFEFRPIHTNEAIVTPADNDARNHGYNRHQLHFKTYESASASSSLIATDNDEHLHNIINHRHHHEQEDHNNNNNMNDNDVETDLNIAQSTVSNYTNITLSLNNHPQASQTLQPPPRQNEQTAREQLIERERQARLERETARLKRQLALSRERDEEDEIFNEIDRARRERIASSSEVRSHGSTHTSLNVMDLDLMVEELNHNDGGASGVSGNDEEHENEQNLIIEYGIQSAHVSAVAANVVGNNINTCRDNDGGISSDVRIVMNENEISNNNHIPTITGSNNNNDGGGGNNNVNGATTAPSPLGFTMERFLQDGVVVLSTTSAGSPENRGRGEIQVDDCHDNNQNDNDENNNSTNDSDHNNDNSGTSRTGDMIVVIENNVVHHQQHEESGTNSLRVSDHTHSNHNHHGHTSSSATESSDPNNTIPQLFGLGGAASSNFTSGSGGIADISLEAGLGNSSDMLSETGSSDIGSGGDLNNSASFSRNYRDDGYQENMPRLARLTEAEILEMAEIDYASVGNMPPRSERDEQHLQSIHDLTGLGRMSNVSDQTHTTMLESVSITSADIGIMPSDDVCSEDIDGTGNESIRSTAVDVDTDVEVDMIISGHHHGHEEDQLENEHARSIQEHLQHENLTNNSSISTLHIADAASATMIAHDSSDPPIEAVAPMNPNEIMLSTGNATSAYNDSILANRSETSEGSPQKLSANLLLRDETQDGNNGLQWSSDGFNPPPSPPLPPSDNTNVARAPSIYDDLDNGAVVETKDHDLSIERYDLPNRIIRPGVHKIGKRTSPSLHRRSQTTPNIFSFVDDFDYCKYNDTFNTMTAASSIAQQGEGASSNQQLYPRSSFNHYGSTNVFKSEDHRGVIIQSPEEEERDEEVCRPLINRDEFDQYDVERSGYRDKIRRGSIDDIMDSVFSSVRSLSTEDIQADINDCDEYLASNVIERAFPERFFALIVTVIIEIPVLLMISGGSSKLCALVGRRKYQLLMAFLPLSSAISGNCGLQASSLATRAISHLHVTRENYWTWLGTELKVAALLGIGMGMTVGIMAYYASGFDIAFGCTIFIANFISVCTAGLTGTIAPLMFTFIFHRDSGKWGGPIETAIQDIVGSFVMVILSYKILLFLGPGDIDPRDVC